MDYLEKKLPRSGMALFVKFYCKQFNQDRKRNINAEDPLMIAATKAWLTLSKQEKMVFNLKLKDYKEEYKKNFAEHLKSVECYMKKKKKRKPNLNENEPDATLAMESEDFTQNNEEVVSNTNSEQPSQEQAECRQIDHKSPDPTQLPLTETSSKQNELEPEVPEPVPPSVSSAEKLFQFVQSKEGGDRSWSSLSLLEKRRYQSSILALKKTYIQKYKAYLESLPSEELFRYYITKLRT